MASVSDNFDRANGEIGANWTEDGGDVDIVSNKAADNSSGTYSRLRYTGTALDSADHDVEADVNSDGVNSGGLTARQESDTETMYLAYYKGPWDGDGWKLVKVVASNHTELDGEATAGTPDPALVWLEIDGAVQTATLDGAQQLDGTDSDIEAGLYVGIWAGFESGTIWDNWSAEDLAAPAVAAPTAVLDGPLAGPLGGPI